MFNSIKLSIMNLCLFMKKQEVKHIAKLIKVKIDEADLDSYGALLEKVFKSFEILESLDVTGNSEFSNDFIPKNVMREDIVEPSLDRDLVLKNTKNSCLGYFKIKRVIRK